MLEEKIHIKIKKTARLVLLKSENNNNRKLLIALHGYGQLSTYFSKKFKEINSNFDVLVPEGLNRFYLKESSGRVGSSWMTKEDREFDIEDNQDYLDEIIKEYSTKYESIILLGFSQGGATASRYCYKKANRIKGLVLWGSAFPPDITKEENNSFKGEKYFVLGLQDEYFNKEIQKDVLALQMELGYTIIQYDGIHDIDISVLNGLLDHF